MVNCSLENIEWWAFAHFYNIDSRLMFVDILMAILDNWFSGSKQEKWRVEPATCVARGLFNISSSNYSIWCIIHLKANSLLLAASPSKKNHCQYDLGDNQYVIKMSGSLHKLTGWRLWNWQLKSPKKEK